MTAHFIYNGFSGVAGDDVRRARRICVYDVFDEDDALAEAVALAPTDIGGLPRRNIEFEEGDSRNGIWLYTVNYGSSSNRPDLDSGEIEWEFNFSAPSFHAKQSIATISGTGLGSITEKKAGGGTVSVDHAAEDFHGAINVSKENGQYRIEGVQISPPPETFSIRYAAPNAVVSAAYLQELGRICSFAPVNATPVGLIVPGVVGIVTYAAGELMLVRATGSKRNNDSWQFSFGFAASPNLTEIDVGGITVPAKLGHEYLWAYYGDTADNASGNLIKRPVAAYVEQVYHTSEFRALGIVV